MSTLIKTVISGKDIQNTLKDKFPEDECELVLFEVDGSLYEGFYYVNDDGEAAWYARDNVMGYEEKVTVPDGTPVFWLSIPTLQNWYEEEHPKEEKGLNE